jgi:hypothetical protein
MTPAPQVSEVKRQIRESLGLPPIPEMKPQVPVGGHVCEFPLWSYSKKRAGLTRLHIAYEDGSFLTIKAPEGMPGPRFPGYLDVILFYGQRDLFLQDHTTLSVYAILSNSRCSPTHSLQLHHAFMTTVCRPPLRSLRDMDYLEEATENLGGTPPADARKTHVSFPTACAAFLRLSLRVAR